MVHVTSPDGRLNRVLGLGETTGHEVFLIDFEPVPIPQNTWLQLHFQPPDPNRAMYLAGYLSYVWVPAIAAQHNLPPGYYITLAQPQPHLWHQLGFAHPPQVHGPAVPQGVHPAPAAPPASIPDETPPTEIMSAAQPLPFLAMNPNVTATRGMSAPPASHYAPPPTPSLAEQFAPSASSETEVAETTPAPDPAEALAQTEVRESEQRARSQGMLTPATGIHAVTPCEVIQEDESGITICARPTNGGFQVEIRIEMDGKRGLPVEVFVPLPRDSIVKAMELESPLSRLSYEPLQPVAMSIENPTSIDTSAVQSGLEIDSSRISRRGAARHESSSFEGVEWPKPSGKPR